MRFRLYKAGARITVWLSKVLNAMAEWFSNRADWWIDRMAVAYGEQEEK